MSQDRIKELLSKTWGEMNEVAWKELQSLISAAAEIEEGKEDTPAGEGEEDKPEDAPAGEKKEEATPPAT